MKQAALPWMRSPTAFPSAKPIVLDDVSGLDQRLRASLTSLDVTSLFGVQSAVWKHTGGGLRFDRDLCVCAPTGSGKTLAYALPVVQGLSGQKTTHKLRALIIVPTGDLAFQVARVFEPLCHAVGLHVGVNHVFGDEDGKRVSCVFDASTNDDPTNDEIQNQVDILVTPPGRLVAHLRETSGFSLANLQFFVVDEADRILRQSYQGWLPQVISAVGTRPPRARIGERGVSRKRLKKILISATLTRDPARLAGMHLHAPRMLTAASSGEGTDNNDTAARYLLPDTLQEFVVPTDGDDKPLKLLALLKKLNGAPVIVFTASVEATHRLFLLLDGISGGGLSSKPVEYSSHDSQQQRSESLKAFKTGASSLLIASDAATRGLDVHNVAAVISYDAPTHLKTYVHRVGRTARAGRAGVAYTLCRGSEEKQFLKMLEKVTAAQNRRPPETCDVPERETNAFKKELASSLVAVKLVLEADSKSGFGGNELTEEGVGFTAAARVAAAMACQNFRRGTTVV
jgi:ATP-dependent RNA helicase DDX51/DBP6